MSQKVILLILDGWGMGKNDPEVNAIQAAKTPFFDGLLKKQPYSLLKTDGENVGLPDGQMGNSEVGHLNIGAGRVVYQPLAKINKSIREGKFQKQKELINILDYSEKNGKKLHLAGLTSRGGVHSHLDHLLAIIEMCKERNLDFYIHAITDGRDNDPHSALKEVSLINESLKGSKGTIATVVGRYFAMDRDKRWERTAKAYHLWINGEGLSFSSAEEAVKHSYDQDITDEFIEPSIIDKKGLIEEDDAMIFFNFRTDRPRQIVEALTQTDFRDQNMNRLNLRLLTMTNYNKKYKNVSVLFEDEIPKNVLGEVLSNARRSQIRMAETEKYPHVTFFFNGQNEQPFKLEDRLMVNSPKVATYDLKPEMNAPELTSEVLNAIGKNSYDFILVNIANPDMVGHTGDFKAIVKAVETTDHCAKDIIEKATEYRYDCLITADHGNADFAVNEDGSPNTAHTQNLVPFIYCGDKKLKLNDGSLCDIAPTILELIGTKKPEEMTGKSLIQKS